MTIPISEYVRQGYTPEHGRAANERAEQHALRVEAATELAGAISRVTGGRAIPPPPVTEPPSARDVRQWCAANGVPCSATGRIPVVAMTAYAAHHP